MKDPSISIIIPCYNAARYVAEAVASALEQTLPPVQVIVVDDGSTDGSVEQLAAFGNQIEIVRQSNQGRAAAVHAGVSRARGNVIAFLDADDVWKPRKLEVSVGALQQGDFGFVHSRIILRGASGDRPCHWKADRIQGWALMPLLESNSVCCSSVVMRRDLWDDLGGFVGRHWPCDDYHLWLRAAARRIVAFVDEPLVAYRVHEHQASGRRVQMVKQMACVVADFLSDHPQVKRALSPQMLHRVQYERFVDLALHYARSGRQELARELLTWCVARQPLSTRAWRGWVTSRLPWRMCDVLMRRVKPALREQRTHPAFHDSISA